jgi:hypothetical protein
LAEKLENSKYPQEIHENMQTSGNIEIVILILFVDETLPLTASLKPVSLFHKIRKGRVFEKKQLHLALQRNLTLCIPKKGIARPQSRFSHSCVCERSIYSHFRPTYFPAVE